PFTLRSFLVFSLDNELRSFSSCSLLTSTISSSPFKSWQETTLNFGSYSRISSPSSLIASEELPASCPDADPLPSDLALPPRNENELIPSSSSSAISSNRRELCCSRREGAVADGPQSSS